jgi:hypothetical protein
MPDQPITRPPAFAVARAKIADLDLPREVCSCKDSSSAHHATALPSALARAKIAEINLPRKVCSCKNA